MTNGSHDSWLMAAAMAVATLLTALTVVAINVVFVHWLLSCSWIMASAVSLLVLAISAVAVPLAIMMIDTWRDRR